MATDLDTLTGQEKKQKDTIEHQIAAGLAAQAKLAQVQALYAELVALQERRTALVGDGGAHVGSVDAGYADASKGAADVLTALGPVDAFLGALPGTLTQADLEAVVNAALPSPPDSSKLKIGDYVDALAKEQNTLATAVTDAAKARVTVTRAREDLTAAEAALQAVADRATVALREAQAAKDEALRARSGNDIPRAYWYDTRAKAAAGIVTASATKKAIGDAENALKAAYDAYADAVDKRLAAEDAVVKAQANVATLSDQLGDATAQVLKALAAVVKAKSP
jgi:hypothetical protein